MHSETESALVDRLSRYESLVEVGIGRRHGVAAGLAARGRRIVATDVHHRDVPGGVAFVRDDVTAADPTIYRGAEAVYALNCPPELQSPLVSVAASVGADCLFTTLGTDPAVVEASPETLPGATLFAV